MYLIGDLLLEYSIDRQEYRLGGIGNVLNHLKDWFDTVYLSVSDVQRAQLEMLRARGYNLLPANCTLVKSINSMCKPIPLRVWHNNQFVLKEDYDFVYLSQGSHYHPMEFKDITIANKIDVCYLEHHFPDTGNLDDFFYWKADASKNAKLFLDSRHPNLIFYSLMNDDLAPENIYWKTNNKEMDILAERKLDQYFRSNASRFNHIETLADKGFRAYFVDGNNYQLAAQPHAPVQTIGCGDSFFATFAGAIMNNYSREQALALANTAGHIAAMNEETYVVSRYEVEHINQRKEPMTSNVAPMNELETLCIS